MQRKPALRHTETPTKKLKKLCPRNACTDVQPSVAAHPTGCAMLCFGDSTGRAAGTCRLMPMHELQACILFGLPGGLSSSAHV